MLLPQQNTVICKTITESFGICGILLVQDKQKRETLCDVQSQCK